MRSALYASSMPGQPKTSVNERAEASTNIGPAANPKQNPLTRATHPNHKKKDAYSDPIWKTLDLKSKKKWELTETHNILYEVRIEVDFVALRENEGLDDGQLQSRINALLQTVVDPLLAALPRLMKPLSNDQFGPAMQTTLGKVRHELGVYKAGPSSNDEQMDGATWVRQHVPNLQAFLRQYISIGREPYELSTDVKDSTERSLHLEAVMELLLPFLGYFLNADPDQLLADPALTILLAQKQKRQVEQAIANVFNWVDNHGPCKTEKIAVNVDLLDRFVANSDDVESNCVGCKKFLTHVITDPVTGETLPYLIDSPSKTEKIVLKGGRVIPERLKATYRVAVSCTDLTHSNWTKTESANGKYCTDVDDESVQSWDSRRRLTALSMHSSRAKESLMPSSVTGNSKDGGPGAGLFDGKYLRPWIEEAMLTMNVGEVAILRHPTTDAETGRQKYEFVQLRNEGFLESECGSDCCGCEEGVVLMSSSSTNANGSGNGIGNYQAMRCLGVVCTVHSCKSCCKCLLTTGAMCTALFLVGADAANN